MLQLVPIRLGLFFSHDGGEWGLGGIALEHMDVFYMEAVFNLLGNYGI